MTSKAASSQDMRELATQARLMARYKKGPLAEGERKTLYSLADAIDQAAAQRKGLVTPEMVELAVKGMMAARLRDDEGPIPTFRDLIDCSGENLFWTIARGLARAALTAALHPEGKSETSENKS